MSAITKTLLIIIAVLLLLVGGALAYLNLVFDPNDYKPEIRRLAQTHAGVDLELQGDIEWSLYPWLGLGLNQVRARLPQQGDTPFAAMKQAQLSVKLMPLLSGRIEMDALQLNGLQVNLVKDAQGRGNWEQLGATQPAAADDTGAPQPTEPELAPTDTPEGQPSPAIDLAIAQISIQDAQFNYTDRQTGQQVSIKRFNLTSQNVSLEKPFLLELDFITENQEPPIHADVTLRTQTQLNLEAQRYELQNLKLQTQLESPQNDSKPLLIKLQGDVLADMAQAVARIDSLELQAADTLQLQGHLGVKNFDTAPRFDGKLTLAEFNPRQLLQKLQVELPPTRNPDALSSASLNMTLGGPANTLELQPLQLTLDNTKLQGQLSANLDTTALRFDLTGNTLSLDDYLPPPTEEKEEEKTPAPQQETELLPVDTLRTLDLAGTLKLQKLVTQGLTLEEIDLAINAQNGLLQLERANARLYEGTYTSSARVDVTQTPIRHQLSHQLEGVQSLPLLQDLADMELLRGQLQLKGDYHTQGNTLSHIMEQLNGEARFQVNDGALQQVNLSQQLCTAIALAKGDALDQEWGPDTPFEQLSGTVEIRNGVAHNDDLTISVPGLKLTGEGQVNLPDNTLNYSLGALITGDKERQACRVDKNLQQVRWPVRCQGAFSDKPTSLCKVDSRNIGNTIKDIAKAELEAKAKAELEREKQKAEEKVEQEKQEAEEKLKSKQEELKQKAEEGLQDKLKGLFN